MNAFPPSGFVNCAADDTAPFRLARTLRNRLKKTRRFRSLSKAFDKERYAKVEVMSSSLVSEAG